MKITNNGKKIKTYYIEVDDKELELLCDAMDSNHWAESLNIEQIKQAGWNASTSLLNKVKELSKILHNAYMGKI